MPNEIIVFSKSGTFPNTEHMKGSPYSLTVKLDLDKMPPKMVKDLEKDPLFRSQVTEKVQAIHAEMLKDVGAFMGKFDKEIEKGASTADDVKDFQKQVDRVVTELVSQTQKDAEASVKTGWEGLRKKKLEYKAYTGKVKATLAVKSTFLVGGVALTAVSAPTGAGLVIGIAGLIKGAVDLGKTIRNAAQEAESTVKRLKANLKGLQKVYGESKAKLVAGEAFSATFNAFILPIIPNITECDDDLELTGKKMLGIEVNAHKLAKSLEKILNEVDKLQKACKTDPKALKKIEPLEKTIGEEIPAIQKLCGRVDAIEEEIKPLRKQLKDLKDKKPEALEYFEKGLKFADALVSAAQGDAEGIVVALTQVSAEFAVDKIFE